MRTSTGHPLLGSWPDELVLLLARADIKDAGSAGGRVDNESYNL